MNGISGSQYSVLNPMQYVVSIFQPKPVRRGVKVVNCRAIDPPLLQNIASNCGTNIQCERTILHAEISFNHFGSWLVRMGYEFKGHNSCPLIILRTLLMRLNLTIRNQNGLFHPCDYEVSEFP